MKFDSVVSVVIPTFNRAKFITRALNSVLEQTYQHLEVIIVDDCSTDNTKEVVDGISDRRIQYLEHTETKGGASARNTGIKAAKGEFIAFLDSDDIWDHKKIESQVNFFRQNGCSDNSILFAKVKMDNNGVTEVMPSHNSFEQGLAISDYIFVHNGLISTIVLFMKTDLAKRTMFTEKLKKHQDYDFVLRAYANGVRFYFQNEIMATWFCEPRPDRMGRKVEYEYSYHWLDCSRHLFTPEAYKRFIVRDIIPQVLLNKFSLKALFFLILIMKKRELSMLKFLKTSVKLFVRNPFRHKVSC